MGSHFTRGKNPLEAMKIGMLLRHPSKVQEELHNLLKSQYRIILYSAKNLEQYNIFMTETDSPTMINFIDGDYLFRFWWWKNRIDPEIRDPYFYRLRGYDLKKTNTSKSECMIFSIPPMPIEEIDVNKFYDIIQTEIKCNLKKVSTRKKR